MARAPAEYIPTSAFLCWKGVLKSQVVLLALLIQYWEQKATPYDHRLAGGAQSVVGVEGELTA